MTSLADDPKFRWQTPAVDACLRLADELVASYSRVMGPRGRAGHIHALRVLAREVRALREELRVLQLLTGTDVEES